MKRKESNLKVIEIKTNRFDEQEIRERFEKLLASDKVVLVLLIEDNCNEEAEQVGREYQEADLRYGVYDITMLDEDDSLIITDMSEYLDNSSMDEEKFQSTKYVVKCNLCNYSFIHLSQLRQGFVLFTRTL